MIKILELSQSFKKHWNTVIFDTDVPEEEVYRLIDISYELVFESLTKKAQKEVSGQSNKEKK